MMVLTTEKKALIWKSLNDTRGGIEPSEYKNYIFGIMFYKFLSEKAQTWLEGVDHKKSQIQNSDELFKAMQKKLGYIIRPGEMFSDWKKAIDEGKFNIAMVIDALSHFDQGVSQDAKENLAGIFDGMDLVSSRLGPSNQTRTATLVSWIKLLDKTKLDTQDNVSGDLYEYLIEMFANNSGAKSTDFYTPHQVSDIMARILTEGCERQREHTLYDPAMGSGSLLLTTSSYMHNIVAKEGIKFYGQEIITTTYNLARMNLMMHGVDYKDIDLRNADTLQNDWPNGPINGVDTPRLFDTVMVNPPYSLRWDNTSREDDPRFRYGVAPKSKADYAFLLHGLYHLKSNGRMAIVLPHGVLFRGAAEKKIRKQLLEHHNISAIIGLPANIFNNTAIPTVIMVLEKDRESDDILFVDASKGFEKYKNKNIFRQEDIDKIIETYRKREDVSRYSHVATMAEVIENDYNLNIPRYVDTFIPPKIIPLMDLEDQLNQLNKQLSVLEEDGQRIMTKYQEN